jgi:hypothetical protein
MMAAASITLAGPTMCSRTPRTSSSASDDGVRRVVELGDAQVSDRPATLRPSRLIRAVRGRVHQLGYQT